MLKLAILMNLEQIESYHELLETVREWLHDLGEKKPEWDNYIEIASQDLFVLEKLLEKEYAQLGGKLGD
jgi:hypothetical protein